MLLLALTGCKGGDTSGAPAGQEAVAEEIKSLGGLYSVDHKKPEAGIVSVVLSNTAADDAMVEKLTALQGLKTLNLNNTKITDKSLESFKKMKLLEELNVGNTKLSDEGLDQLAEAMPDTNITLSQRKPPSSPDDEPAPELPREGNN